MAYSIAHAAAKLGVHPTTVRRQIRSGRLPAELVGGQWTIDDGTIAQTLSNGARSKEKVHDGDGSGYPALVTVLERQLEEKDRQIRELHVLLQAAQERTQRMLPVDRERSQRRWWPF